jgi:molecular chaperone GrpE
MRNSNDEDLEILSSCCNGNQHSHCHDNTNEGAEPEDRLDVGSMSHEELVEMVASASKRITELEATEKDYVDKNSRLLADFVNYKNRVAREVQFAVTMSEKKLLLEFLPIVDNFERCLALTYANVEDLHGGVVLIHKQLQEVLRKVGVEGVDIKAGDLFNAQHSEALTTVNRSDLPDGTVATVFERGFMLRDQLLRPARVIVNQQQSIEQ